jgi:hypothetical protein
MSDIIRLWSGAGDASFQGERATELGARPWVPSNATRVRPAVSYRSYGGRCAALVVLYCRIPSPFWSAPAAIHSVQSASPCLLTHVKFLRPCPARVEVRRVLGEARVWGKALSGQRINHRRVCVGALVCGTLAVVAPWWAPRRAPWRAHRQAGCTRVLAGQQHGHGGLLSTHLEQ